MYGLKICMPELGMSGKKKLRIKNPKKLVLGADCLFGHNFPNYGEIIGSLLMVLSLTSSSCSKLEMLTHLTIYTSLESLFRGQ